MASISQTNACNLKSPRVSELEFVLFSSEATVMNTLFDSSILSVSHAQHVGPPKERGPVPSHTLHTPKAGPEVMTLSFITYGYTHSLSKCTL